MFSLPQISIPRMNLNDFNLEKKVINPTHVVFANFTEEFSVDSD